MSPTPVEVTVDVNGVSLFTRTLGAGPSVTVLHGGPGAHHDYLLPQFDALAAGRRLRYYDQRGGGRSSVDRRTPVAWSDHVADLDALLAGNGDCPATLLGYSWGGLLAILYAIQHPDRVSRLALVSPAPVTAAGRRVFEERFTARSRDPDLLAARDALRSSGLRDRDPDAYRQRLFELSVAPYFADPARARDLTPFRVNGRTQTAVWTSLGDYDLQDALGRLKVPALVLHGRHDPIPIETARETAGLLGAPLRIMEHSGHVPYIEDFDAFRDTLDGFLPRVP